MREPLELEDDFELYAEALPEEADLQGITLQCIIVPPQCVIFCYPPEPPTLPQCVIW